MWGYQCLLAFPFCLMYPAWYANLILLLGFDIARLGMTRVEILITGAAALAFALSLLWTIELSSLRIGYWVWLLAIATFSVGSSFKSVSPLVK